MRISTNGVDSNHYNHGAGYEQNDVMINNDYFDRSVIKLISLVIIQFFDTG